MICSFMNISYFDHIAPVILCGSQIERTHQSRAIPPGMSPVSTERMDHTPATCDPPSSVFHVVNSPQSVMFLEGNTASFPLACTR